MALKGTIVTDLDMTVFDCRHRLHLEKEGQFDEFHSLCHKDGIFTDVADVLRSLSPKWRIIAVTGRPVKWSNVTTKMLQKHELWVDHLLMRPNNNYQRNEDLKISLLEDFFGDKEAVLGAVSFVLEDRDKVVEALRNYGLNVWQVRAPQ